MSVTINDLGKFEDYLYFSSDIDRYIKTLSDKDKEKFNDNRINFSKELSKLRQGQLELVTKKIEEASSKLQQGIDNMERQITSLQNVATILNTFSQMLSVVVGIVSFVASHP